MLALDFVKANRETVERAIRDKGVTLDLDEVLTLDAEVRAGKTEIDRLRAERNAVSARFKDASPQEKADLGRQAKEAGARASALEADLTGKEEQLRALMLQLPGIPYVALRSRRAAHATYRDQTCRQRFRLRKPASLPRTVQHWPAARL